MDTLSLTKEARICNEEKTPSSINDAGKQHSYMQKNKTKTLPNTIHTHTHTHTRTHTHTQNHSKWIKDLNVQPENYKALKGKHRQYTL